MKDIRLVFVCLLMCAAALAGCSENAQKGAMPPALVKIFTVVAKNQPYPAEYQAVTQGSKAVEVRARVEAIIEKRLYTEGDFVKEGQQLFQLERDVYEARLQDASAQFNRAQREWNRIRPLYEKNAVSQKDRDAARAAYETAKANVRAAEINLGYCQVVAPVSGYTGKENFTEGNLVSNSMLLTSINQTNPLYVNFAIPATDRMLRQQMAANGKLIAPENNTYKARIRLVDGSMYDKEGLVNFIDTQVDQTMGVVKARAQFPNDDDYVLPGQYVRLLMEGDMLKDAILIPQRCVLMTQKGTLVMVVGENNVVEMRPVKLGVSVGSNYYVEAGLKNGERIILEGLVKARPGQPVRIDDGKPAQGAQPGQPAQAGKAAPAAQDKPAAKE